MNNRGITGLMMIGIGTALAGISAIENSMIAFILCDITIVLGVLMLITSENKKSVKKT